MVFDLNLLFFYGVLLLLAGPAVDDALHLRSEGARCQVLKPRTKGDKSIFASKLELKICYSFEV